MRVRPREDHSGKRPPGWSFFRVRLKFSGKNRFFRAIALMLIPALLSACQIPAEQIYIPLAYGLTGLCLVLLVYPTPAAGVLGFLLGCILGAAVYNNSLKRRLLEP